MNRLKTYEIPHKALRNALSQFSLLAGNTSYSNPNQVDSLYQLGNDIFKLLKVHADDENQVVLAALETRCPGGTNHDLDDHGKIDAAQNKLEQLLSKIHEDSKSGKDVSEDAAEFYLSLSEFHGQYLEHIAEEERVTQQLIWQHFSDEELIAIRGKIIARIPPETMLIWFRFIIPSQSPNERVGFLSGIMKMAPVEFFNQGMEVISKTIPSNEFESLKSILEGI